MQKIIVTVAAILVVFFSFGNREIYKNDISNRLIIQGIGIDCEKDGMYTVTIQAINTSVQSASANNDTDQTVKVYQVTDKTIYSAIKSIIEFEGKVPLYSQNRVIVIGKEIADAGIKSVIDFFVRDADVGPSVYIAMAEDRASDILSATVEGEIIPKNIEQAIMSSEYEPEIFKLELYELVNRYKDDNSCFAMPVLTKIEESEEQVNVQVKETAIFKNGKYRTSISRRETVMLNFLYNNMYNGDLTFDVNDDKATLSITNAKTVTNVKREGDSLRFDIKVNVDADIAEFNNGLKSAMDSKELDDIRNAAEESLKRQLLNLLNKMYGDSTCDVVGYSRLVLRKIPNFYREQKENLDTVLKQSQYDVEVNITLRRTGHDLIELF